MSRFDRNFIDQVLARTSIIEVVGRKVIWDKRKSQPARGDMWACCPFHSEKSPSFHATESKATYHCFGCGASGTAVDFIMNTENLGFTEAIEQLAIAVGMDIPKPSREAQQKHDKSALALAAINDAKALFEQALIGQDGAKAREYLLRRGIIKADWQKFGLGFAPAHKNWLKDRLVEKGHSIEAMIDGGLLRLSDDGGPAYEVYRGRLMFAIDDASGKTISFGARTLDPDGQPKYLNGPESLVFSKSHTLYRYHQARKAAKNQPIIVAEGYIDVISLERAGFAAVAPMGTALTPDQLNLAWRVCPKPVLCFDGDDAGIRAGTRALERALPLVASNKSLAFILLPKGQDPDDIIQNQGRAKMLDYIENARSLSTFLFSSEMEVRELSSAEARADLRARLRAKTNEIKDEDLKNEIRHDLKGLLDAQFGRSNAKGQANANPILNVYNRTNSRYRPPANASEELKAIVNSRTIDSAKSKTKTSVPPRILLDIITAPIGAPHLLELGLEAYTRLEIADKGLDSLRSALLDVYNSHGTLDFALLNTHLKEHNQQAALRALEFARKTPLNPYVKRAEGKIQKQNPWLAAIEKLEVQRALKLDAKEAIAQIGEGEEAAFKRLTLLVNQRRVIEKDDLEDS